jgi:hypothetical protein
VDVLESLDFWIVTGLWIIGIPVGGFAFVHALRQRADAFTAVGKLTKNAWLGITGVALLLLILITSGPMGSGAIFWLAAVVAVLVYIVDVKPAVVGVQRGDQRW